MRHHVKIPWWSDGQTSRRITNVQCGKRTLLVARSTNICQELCPRMQNMSTIQDRQNPNKTCIYASRGGKINLTIHKLFHGFNNWLTTSDGYDSILVVVDRGNTKGAILIPTTKILTQEEAGQLLLDNLYKQFGLPDEMLSDRGPQFAAMAFRELSKLLGIKSNLTMAYHPQINRATEQVNQEIEAYLWIYCSAHPTKWKNSSSTLELTHNNQWHADGTHTSFDLMHGKAPLAIPTSFKNTNFPSVAEKIKNLVTSWEEALAAHELAQSQMVEQIK